MSENKYSFPLFPTPHIYWFNGKLVQVWEYDKPIVPYHPSLAFPVDKSIKPLRDSKVPQPVPNPDLKNLLDTMNSILEFAEERGYVDDDAQSYVWQVALEAFYGKEIWDWINKKR